MATTLIQRRKRGADPSKLTACEQKFILELLAARDWNLAAAVRKAYPKIKDAAQYGTKLMKRPRIKAILGKLQQEDAEKLELDRLEVLRQLWFALTRKVEDFCDERGYPLPPHRLPEQCQSIVDGYKVKILKTRSSDETTEELIEVEYKLTPHAVAREQAMKHKGLFTPEQLDISLIQSRNFLEEIGRPLPPDEIEKRLTHEQKPSKSKKGKGG